MAEFARVQGVELPSLVEDESLCEWVSVQRWYASKSRSISGAHVVESIVLREERRTLDDTGSLIGPSH